MKTNSPQKAIAAYCKGCIYDPKTGGNHLDQIEACTIIACELFKHRPLTRETKAEIQRKIEKAMTPDQLARLNSLREKRSKSMADLHLSGKLCGRTR